MPKLIDITRQRFNRLVVINQAETNKWGKLLWLCRCDCGKEIIVRGCDLKSGNTKSCGCLQKEITAKRSTKHGHKKMGKETKIYKAWKSMKQRCTNPNDKKYKDYGGRGITVCKEWLHSFTNFERDNPGWKPCLTLERDNNELGYFKDNCYWATWKEQARNKRNTLYVSYGGGNRILIELCEEYNMSYKLVYERIYKLGWSVEKALTTPVRKRRKNGRN